MVITGSIFNITAPVKEYLSQFSKEDCLSNSINQKVCGIFNKYAYDDRLYVRNYTHHERCNRVYKIYGIAYNKSGRPDIRADIHNSYITLKSKDFFSDLLYLYCSEDRYIAFLKDLFPDLDDEQLLAYKLYNEVM